MDVIEISLSDLEGLLRQQEERIILTIHQLLKARNKTPQQKWVKSQDVCRILGLSAGTVKSLRVNGRLPYAKIGNVIFFNLEDVETMLVKNKTVNMPCKQNP